MDSLLPLAEKIGARLNCRFLLIELRGIQRHLRAGAVLVVVGLLNDLEASGLVERRRDPTDRRRHIVTMTEQGRKALHQAESAQQTLEDEVLGALDSNERAELSQLMRKAIKGHNTNS